MYVSTTILNVMSLFLFGLGMLSPISPTSSPNQPLHHAQRGHFTSPTASHSSSFSRIRFLSKYIPRHNTHFYTTNLLVMTTTLAKSQRQYAEICAYRTQSPQPCSTISVLSSATSWPANRRQNRAVAKKC